jgi:diguanylate cyclase
MMTQKSGWDGLRRLLLLHSLRKQYLLLALLLATVVVASTWIASSKVNDTGKVNSYNIEQRIKVADLSHRLRRSIVAADTALNLFLLSPNDASRKTFEEQLLQSHQILADLQAINWVNDSETLSMLLGMKPLLSNLASAGAEVMTVRQDANLMYPAMRLANGQMLEDNLNFLASANNAIRVLQDGRQNRWNQPQLKMLGQFYETRDRWHRMISSYRLYLINRIASLHEDVLQNQTEDIDLLYNAARDKFKELAKFVEKRNIDIEISMAVSEMDSASLRWYETYREVVRINKEGHWRGDVPIMKDVTHPLLGKIYEKLDQLENEIKQSANLDLAGQTQLGDNVVHSLWGMALFVLVMAIISLLLLEFNLIRPIAGVARSLKDEARGKDVELPAQVQTSEIRDLTDAFREMRQQVHSRQMALEHIAMHDSLTSLPNRALLMDRLNQAIENARRRERTLALIMLDLDRFKEINDTLGHQIGDALLQQVGSRLRGVLRDSDTVARLGGDEFAILLTSVNEENALLIAAGIHEALEKVYEVYEHSLYVGVSLGVAIFPEHGDTSELLLQHSDVAMYMAKRSNIGISLYDTNRDQHSVSNLSVLSELRSAIENDEFFLQYQPKMSLHSGQITGVEALVRWRHPVHGLVMPDTFISTAEQTGLIKRISPWLLDRAIADGKRLHDMGHKLSMSVNLSVWDIQDGKLANLLRHKLQKANFPAEYLMLEITERVMMAEPERADQVLKEIDKMGVKIGIDDFGTGFSSLVYLKQMPVDTLKIDKSFVMDMLSDESNSTIVHSIIELAHNLGLDVIAEGVENDQTWSWLKKWRCDFAQGYYISHPLSFGDLEIYLKSSNHEFQLG